MKSICGTDCSKCDYYKNDKCQGCNKTKGCPFGKKCFIAKYIEVGGIDNYLLFKKKLIDEINALEIEGLSIIDELYPLNGELVNLEYRLPNKNKMKYLNDNEIYLGTQVESQFNDDKIKKCYGIVGNMNFILVSEYEEEGKNPELIIYKKR